MFVNLCVGFFITGDVLSPLLVNLWPLGGSISPCYRACETARLRRVFVCNNGFSLFSFVFFFFLPLHIIFSGLICCDKSAGLYYGLIN